MDSTELQKPYSQPPYKPIPGFGRNLLASIQAHPACHANPSPDPRWPALLALLTNPSNAGTPYAQLCSKAGIRVAEIISVYMEFQRSQAVMEVADRIPEVARQLVDDAVKRVSYCTVCRGKGYTFEECFDEHGYPVIVKVAGKKRVQRQKVKCLDCDGSGKADSPANPEARERVLEISGLISTGPRNAAATVNLNFGSVEDTTTEIGKIVNVSPGK
jgi:hypothetical protein